MAKAIHSNEFLKSITTELGYVLTTDGRLFNKHGRKIGTPCTGHKYMCITIRGKYVRIHRLMWVTFKGPIPDGYEINHINGDRQDNRLSNLELVTPSENNKQRHANNPSNHLTKDEAYNLLDDFYIRKMTREDLMEKYNRTYRGVCQVINAESFKNLNHPYRDAA